MNMTQFLKNIFRNYFNIIKMQASFGSKVIKEGKSFSLNEAQSQLYLTLPYEGLVTLIIY